jgi:hypothetical protein
MTEALRLTEIIGRMPYASNSTLLAQSEDGRLWVYKPMRGEHPLWDFTFGSLGYREILAYEVSEAMGLELVPETVLAEGRFGPGSAQRFLDEDADFDPRPMFLGHLDERLWPFAVFDIVTNNADRKLGHLLREVGVGRFWAIDNGLTFHEDPKLRTVLWGFAGQRLPAALVDGVERLSRALDDGLCERIAELLTPREAGAMVQRVAALLEQPTHPMPPEDRPAVPWPMW